MAKIRLTKTELKRQKENLGRFCHYLPMLQLKKKQLQSEIIKIRQAIREVAKEIEQLRNSIIVWVDVFAESASIEELCSLKSIKTVKGSVAGIDLPVFERIEFQEKPYDFLRTPLWIDKGLRAAKKTLTLKAPLAVYHEEVYILKEELRITTQRVNLLEKIKIPEAKENIRLIQIFLGELRTAEVVRGKIAKAKIERKRDAVSV